MEHIVWDDPCLTLDARRRREVFARYGLAVHNAQCLEKQLAIMLALAEPTFFTKTPKDRDSLFDHVLSKSFGPIWNKLRTIVPFESTLVSKISRARKLRNYLIHDYFWDHAADLLNDEGQELLISELSDAANLFNEIDETLIDIVYAYSSRLGVTEETIKHGIEKLRNRE